jgi:hypothetical protein
MTTDSSVDASEAGFVFRGRVVGDDVSALVRLPDDTEAVAVTVDEVLHATDVLQGLLGQTVVLVTGEAPPEPGVQHVFFTDCVSLGSTALLREVERRDDSDTSVAESAELMRSVRERPRLDRAAAAAMIVAGEVTSSEPLEPGAPPSSEHDPEWWVARIAVQSTVKGSRGRKRVETQFANSTDIAWYRSPKLHPGVTGVFLLHTADDVPVELRRAQYQCVDPLDWAPIEELGDVERTVREAEER